MTALLIVKRVWLDTYPGTVYGGDIIKSLLNLFGNSPEFKQLTTAIFEWSFNKNIVFPEDTMLTKALQVIMNEMESGKITESEFQVHFTNTDFSTPRGALVIRIQMNTTQ